MGGISATPPYYPAPNLVAVTPSDSADIAGIPSNGCKIHNKGTSGSVFVDGAESGTNVEIYLRQGDWAPVMVRRVYLAGLGGGVSIIAAW